MKGKGSIVACLLLLAGCSYGSSRGDYAKALHYLRARDYPHALTYFQEGVRTDPQQPKNYHGLAKTYLALGKWQEAWHNSREAIKRLREDDQSLEAEETIDLFRRIFNHFENEHRLFEKETTEEQVLGALGEPDLKIDDPTKEGSTWVYGVMGFYFQNQKLMQRQHHWNLFQ
ncbi:MAG: tetratricopeptide repeat protein [Anaerolineae bacterium]